MKKNKILVTRNFPKDVLDRAEQSYYCQINKEDVMLTTEELIKLAEGMDGILCSSSNQFPQSSFAHLPKSIQIIATYSVGFEHINLEAAKAANITITNTPDVVTDPTADITLLLLLAAARRAREGLSMVTNGEWQGWSPRQLLGIQPRGRRLGILGMGRIGRAVADRAKGFGMKIHYHNRSRLSESLENNAVYHGSYEELFKVADFLSINCELTDETYKLINYKTIKLLPKNVVIVNTSRGGVIDDIALINALKSGRVAAAGLDVFESEPDVNPQYFKLKNAFLLPHMGSATVDARNEMGFRALDNLDTHFRGETPHDKLV